MEDIMKITKTKNTDSLMKLFSDGHEAEATVGVSNRLKLNGVVVNMETPIFMFTEARRAKGTKGILYKFSLGDHKFYKDLVHFYVVSDGNLETGVRLPKHLEESFYYICDKKPS